MRRASLIAGILFGVSTITTLGIVLGTQKTDPHRFYVQPKSLFWEGQKISWSVAISPDGKTLAADAKAGVTMLSTVPEPYLSSHTLSAQGNALAFTHDGNTLVVGGFPLEAWDWKNAKKLWQRGEKSELIYALAVSPDDKTVVTAGLGGWTLWDIKTGKPLWENASGSSLGDSATGVAFSPEGKRVAVATMGGELLIGDVATKTRLRKQTVAAGQRLICVAWSDDGKWLATDGESLKDHQESVTLWDAETGQERFRLPYRTRWTNSLAFLPKSSILAVTTMAGEIHLYDIEQQKVRKTFRHSSAITGLSVSKDGKRIAISSDSGEARYWDITQE